MEDVLIMWK